MSSKRWLYIEAIPDDDLFLDVKTKKQKISLSSELDDFSVSSIRFIKLSGSNPKRMKTSREASWTKWEEKAKTAGTISCYWYTDDQDRPAILGFSAPESKNTYGGIWGLTWYALGHVMYFQGKSDEIGVNPTVILLSGDKCTSSWNTFTTRMKNNNYKWDNTFENIDTIKEIFSTPVHVEKIKILKGETKETKRTLVESFKSTIPKRVPPPSPLQHGEIIGSKKVSSTEKLIKSGTSKLSARKDFVLNKEEVKKGEIEGISKEPLGTTTSMEKRLESIIDKYDKDLKEKGLSHPDELEEPEPSSQDMYVPPKDPNVKPNYDAPFSDFVSDKPPNEQVPQTKVTPMEKLIGSEIRTSITFPSGMDEEEKDVPPVPDEEFKDIDWEDKKEEIQNHEEPMLTTSSGGSTPQTNIPEKEETPPVNLHKEDIPQIGKFLFFLFFYFCNG
jgi:hypothetical protein